MPGRRRLIGGAGVGAAALTLLGGGVALGGSAPSPAVVVTLDRFPQTARAPTVALAAYGGWLAWSRRVAGGYSLVVRDPAGQTGPAGVSPRAEPFDVNLGPVGASGVAAVYSRCGDVARNAACRIVELRLGQAEPVEMALKPPGGGSVHQPAISGHRLAFLRVRPGGGTRQPDDLVEWIIGARRVAVQQVPHTHFTAAQLKEIPGLRRTEGETGQITWLSLTGDRVAYTRVASTSFSDVWIESPGGPPLLADRQGTGGAASGLRTYLNPVIAGPWLYVFRQYTDQGESFVRYNLVRHGVAEQAVLPHVFGESVESAVTYGGGVAWSAGQDPGTGASASTAVELAPQVAWKAILRARPHHVSPGF